MNGKQKNTNGLEHFIGHMILILTGATVALVVVMYLLHFIITREQTAVVTAKVDEPEIEEMYLTPNKYSRPQIPLEKVKGIVIHYTANPGSSAEANRNYFEGLKKKKKYASSHFIVGLDGEIVQCVPLDEIAYASNERNDDTISIECCHEDSSGKFSEATYKSVVALTAWLCGKYNLSEDDIIRHYDVTGKNCPKYYVKHEKAWKKLKKDVFSYISEHEESSGK